MVLLLYLLISTQHYGSLVHCHLATIHRFIHVHTYSNNYTELPYSYMHIFMYKDIRSYMPCTVVMHVLLTLECSHTIYLRVCHYVQQCTEMCCILPLDLSHKLANNNIKHQLNSKIRSLFLFCAVAIKLQLHYTPFTKFVTLCGSNTIHQ